MKDAENTYDQEQKQHEVRARTTSVASDSAWIRRRLSDSVYLWACGEKADDEHEEPKLSERLVGWLILFMQGFAYTTLIVFAGSSSNSDTDNSEEAGLLLPSVTGAMYLLVASTSHDLRAGFSLLVDGTCAGHRTFGLGLLIVYAIMVAAAMKVLVSTSIDNASLVLNSVTVLFIADLDEKALKFLSTIPQKWRLFWAIESIGMSFVLALVAIVYMGDSSPLFETNYGILEEFPTWFIWVLNPAAVTLISVLLCFAFKAIGEFWNDASVSVDEPASGVKDKRAFLTLCVAMKKAKERFKEEPFFYATLAVWFAQAVPSWLLYMSIHGLPVAFDADRTTPGNGDGRLIITDHKLVLVYSNGVLAIGLAAKALICCFRPRPELVTDKPEQRSISGRCGLRECWSSCADSRVPSLLVGWGLGYWVISLLYLLGCSWHGSGCRWNNAPVAVTVLSFIVIPCFLLACTFMVADANFLGTQLGYLVRPAADRLRDRRRTEYWIMASIFRDFIVLWIGLCTFLSL